MRQKERSSTLHNHSSSRNNVKCLLELCASSLSWQCVGDFPLHWTIHCVFDSIWLYSISSMFLNSPIYGFHFISFHNHFVSLFHQHTNANLSCLLSGAVGFHDSISIINLLAETKNKTFDKSFQEQSQLHHDRHFNKKHHHPIGNLQNRHLIWFEYTFFPPPAHAQFVLSI